MNIHDISQLLRSRWITVATTTAAVLLAAGLYTFLQKPLYQASTRLFVSTTIGASANDLYQGNRLSQERVLSYLQLITGETLAQRTIDRLSLDTNADFLKERVTAEAKPDTVLIDVSVVDESPVKARDIANALSDEFVKLVSELESPSPGARPDARVVIEQRARVPEEPVVPKPALNMSLGLFLGLLLGVGFAYLREVLDSTIKDRDTLERITGTGVVGIIPLDKQRTSHPAISFETDNSSIAESFRKLRTNLKFLSVDSPPRIIVVTSSVPNEGKSTNSINIALALAEADQNVLLIDGDMRRPSLHKYLDLVGSVGFSTVLSNTANPDDAFQKTAFPRLTVLSAGPTPPNPSELLGSLAAKHFLNEMRARFDYVIIDSAPLLAVTDATILAAETDGAIVLVRAGHTKVDQVSQSVKALSDVGATLLGTVLSMVPTSGVSAYGYYHYSYE